MRRYLAALVPWGRTAAVLRAFDGTVADPLEEASVRLCEAVFLWGPLQLSFLLFVQGCRTNSLVHWQDLLA